MGPGGSTINESSSVGGLGVTISTAAGAVVTKAAGDQKSYKVRCHLGPGGATMIGSSSVDRTGETLSTATGVAATEAAGGRTKVIQVR